nr:MAG TPA: hypothetical protein [Caudoviricetes sp.]
MAYIPSTIDEQYEYGKSLEISYRALHHDAYLHDKQSNRTIRIPFMSILSKYRDFLDEIIVEQELTLDEQRVYRWNPKKMSEDFYGTTEFWFMLLVLNNYKSVIEFQPKNYVKMYDTDKFKRYLNEIMILEDKLGLITY